MASNEMRVLLRTSAAETARFEVVFTVDSFSTLSLCLSRPPCAFSNLHFSFVTLYSGSRFWKKETASSCLSRPSCKMGYESTSLA